MEQLSVGIVGCGRIAQAHLQALRNVPELRLAAVCDMNKSAARQAAAEFAAPRAFTDYRRMIEELRLDAAIVCTPPVTHPAVVVELLQHGIHVLCEKPLATSSDEAQRMSEAARQAERLLVMASKFRFVEDIVAAKKLLDAGSLGQAVLLTLNFCHPVAMNGRWNADPLISGGGVLMDNGPHVADLARFLCGPITHVQAQCARRAQSLAVEDTVHLCFRNANEILVSADLSWSAPASGDTYLAVSGTGGALCVGWSQSRYRLAGDKEWLKLGNGYDKNAAFVRQLTHFAACARGAVSSAGVLQDALASVRVIEAAYHSMASKCWETVFEV